MEGLSNTDAHPAQSSGHYIRGEAENLLLCAADAVGSGTTFGKSP
jgi:hypothetical protein